MRSSAMLCIGATLTMWACTSEDGPTQPDLASDPPAVGSLLAAKSNSWTARTPRPGAEPLSGTFAAAAPNAAGNSVVYVFGGTDGEGGTGFPASAYDVASDTWLPGPDCRASGFDANGIAKIGNRFYFTGGYTYVETETTLRATQVCDYRHGGLTQKADLPIFSAQGVSGAIDGKLYVLPGFCSGELWPLNPAFCEQETSRRFYRYDPGTNTWQSRAAAPHSHRLGAAAVLGGKFYVAGGFTGGGADELTPVSDLDVYDPKTNTWKTLAPVPTAGRAVGAPLQGKLFVVTDGHAYVYNPATNTWKSRAVPTSRPDALVLVTVGGRPRLVALGPGSAELYTP